MDPGCRNRKEEVDRWLGKVKSGAKRIRSKFVFTEKNVGRRGCRDHEPSSFKHFVRNFILQVLSTGLWGELCILGSAISALNVAPSRSHVATADRPIRVDRSTCEEGEKWNRDPPSRILAHRWTTIRDFDKERYQVCDGNTWIGQRSQKIFRKDSEKRVMILIIGRGKQRWEIFQTKSVKNSKR